MYISSIVELNGYSEKCIVQTPIIRTYNVASMYN